MFNFSHYILALQTFQSFLQKDPLLSWIKVIQKPLTTLRVQLNDKYNEIEYENKFNGQVIYLEHVLNDQFDPVDRLITIEDQANIDYDYLYLNAEGGQTSYVYLDSEGASPYYLNLQAEYTGATHFVVKIPNTGINEIELKSWVAKYKLAGKHYEIEII